MREQKFLILVCFMVFSLIMASFGTGVARIQKERVHNNPQVEENVKDSENATKYPTVTEEPQTTNEEEPNPIPIEDFSKYLTGEGVTMIGDSIMNGNRSIILDQLPNALIDAKGSRDVCGGFEAAQRLDWEGRLSDVVIVELGTNGPLINHEPYASGTQNLLELLGTERTIFWVTVYCDYSQWMDMNNNYIWELAQTRPNIKVIDWYALSVQHPEWFPDGVHPNIEGARNFANLLRESLENEAFEREKLKREAIEEKFNDNVSDENAQ